MADKRNFLLGKGENLTESIVGSGRKLDKSPPYDFVPNSLRKPVQTVK